MDNKDYIRVLLYSYYTSITGWGGPPKESCGASLKGADVEFPIIV